MYNIEHENIDNYEKLRYYKKHENTGVDNSCERKVNYRENPKAVDNF